MNSKYSKTILLIFLGVLLVAFGVFIWAVQTGKISISANMPAPPVIKLTATAVSESQIDLKWESWGTYNGKPVQKYVLKLASPDGARCGSIARCFEPPIYEGKDKSFSHKNLTPNKTYNYIITVYFASSSSDSQVLSFNAEASATTFPQTEGVKLKAEGVSESQINLNWSAPNNYGGNSLQQYKLKVRICGSCKTDAQCYCTISYSDLYSGNNTTFEHKNLSPNITYYYRLEAIYNDSKGIMLYAETNAKPKIGTCAKEDEHYSKVYKDQYPEKCCEGLTEWESGMDTRKVVDGKCVETADIKGLPVGTCINCGDGVCGKNENICNCPKDCKEQPKTCKQNSDCQSTEFCEYTPGKCSGEGKCVAKPTGPIPTLYDPQCGCDKKDYANMWTRMLAGTSLNYKGKCDEKPKPIAPTDVKAEALNQNTIKLTWSGIKKELADDFTVYNNPPIGRVANKGEGNIISFEVSGLNCEQKYSFYVTSNNPQGESEPSKTVSATTKTCSPGQKPTVSPSPTSSPTASPTVSPTAPSGGVLSGLGKLVSTGSNLWINIVIALIGTAAIGYFIFRKDIWK